MSDGYNWWDGKSFSNLGDGFFDCNWAAQGLVIDALRNFWDRNDVVYDNSLAGIMLATSVDEVVKKFVDDLGFRVLTRNPPWRNNKSDSIFLVRHDACVGLWVNDGDLDSRIVTSDPELFAQSKKILEDAIGNKASAGRVYVLISTEEGPKLQSLGVASVPLERDNYSSEVLNDFDAVVSDLMSSNPSGRVAIFDGQPGTGKTFLIRGLLAAVPDALFVLVPSNLIEQLANPGMVSALLETRKNKGETATVFVIEDADECLVQRQEGNVSAVSALLNLGDGILGSLMDLRLVCTTNLRNDELDDAVVRPGRLSRKTHVGPLNPQDANKLYQKLTGTTKEPYRDSSRPTLAEVYSAARGDGWKPVPRKAGVGFNRPETPYDMD